MFSNAKDLQQTTASTHHIVSQPTKGKNAIGTFIVSLSISDALSWLLWETLILTWNPGPMTEVAQWVIDHYADLTQVRNSPNPYMGLMPGSLFQLSQTARSFQKLLLPVRFSQQAGRNRRKVCKNRGVYHLMEVKNSRCPLPGQPCETSNKERREDHCLVDRLAYCPSPTNFLYWLGKEKCLQCSVPQYNKQKKVKLT